MMRSELPLELAAPTPPRGGAVPEDSAEGRLDNAFSDALKKLNGELEEPIDLPEAQDLLNPDDPFPEAAGDLLVQSDVIAVPMVGEPGSLDPILQSVPQNTIGASPAETILRSEGTFGSLTVEQPGPRSDPATPQILPGSPELSVRSDGLRPTIEALPTSDGPGRPTDIRTAVIAEPAAPSPGVPAVDPQSAPVVQAGQGEKLALPIGEELFQAEPPKRDLPVPQQGQSVVRPVPEPVAMPPLAAAGALETPNPVRPSVAPDFGDDFNAEVDRQPPPLPPKAQPASAVAGAVAAALTPDRIPVQVADPLTQSAVSQALEFDPGLSLEPRLGGAERAGPSVQSPAVPQTSTPLPPAQARDIAVQLVAAAKSGTVEVILVPEDLGKVRLTVTALEAGHAITIDADRPEVLETMRRNLDFLSTAFSNAGYDGLQFGFSEQGDGETSEDEGSGSSGDYAPGPDRHIFNSQHQVGWTFGFRNRHGNQLNHRACLLCRGCFGDHRTGPQLRF